MKKYISFLESKFDIVSKIIAILCAVVMLVAIVVEMNAPIDATELENHYGQLEMIKQDVTSISRLENAQITLDSDGMVVQLTGNQHHLKAFFDENKNFLNAVVVDNRIGSSIIVSVLVVLAAFGWGWLASYALLAVLCIPILVYSCCVRIGKAFAPKSKKQK